MKVREDGVGRGAGVGGEGEGLSVLNLPLKSALIIIVAKADEVLLELFHQ